MNEHYEEDSEVVMFPKIDISKYKAFYIEIFEDHVLRILSKTSLGIL